MVNAQAPAKINITLHITGKRADGYHELDSVVAFTSLHDELHVAPDSMLSLTLDGPFAHACGGTQHNLVLRAANALQQATGTSEGARLRLVKNIPPGAGLGGGSADAAVALQLLCELWNVETDLPSLAATLGADVPMFLPFPRRALRVQGIGERVQPYSGPEIPPCAVLVYPNKPLATADVFKAYNGQRGAGNDLQHAAITLMPEIAQILLTLHTHPVAPLAARMTGSGSCCFGLYANMRDARRARDAIAHSNPQWWVQSVVLI